MNIDKNLNIVVPVYADDEKTIKAYVHSTPLSVEVVEQHFLIIGQTFNAIFKQGLGETAGPRYAMMMLKRIAKTTKEWEDDKGRPGPAQDLIEEMRRMTMVAIRNGASWQAVPLQVARDKKVLTDEEVAEVENVIVFFTVVSATLRRGEKREMIEAASALWGAQTSSLNSTAFTASLMTSTAIASSGEKSPAPATAADASAIATVDGKPSPMPS